MAKVENQNIPAQEVIYDPDPARPHTVGEGYAQAVTEGSALGGNSSQMVVRQSPRQGHPSQRGPGTAGQALGRECMKCCGDMWRNSPQYYKDCMKQLYNDREPPARDRQVAPDWFSTPYMMFTRFCVNKCREVGSCDFSIYEIALCPDPNCIGATIGFSTQGMGINETQQLTVLDPNPGGEYTWELFEGGGDIDGDGLYTAPASNENCDQNATINLMCFGTIVDTLDISVNAVSGTAGFLTYCEKSSYAGGYCLECYAGINKRNINCNGTVSETYSGCVSVPCYLNICPGRTPTEEEWEGLCNCAYGRITAPDCLGATHDDNWDRRTEGQLTAGCCPPQFM